MRLAILLVAVAALAAASPAAAQNAPAPQNPCADSLYQVLRQKPLNDLTDREYEYFQLREKACMDYQRFSALANQPQAARRETPVRLEIEPSTRLSTSGRGADIFIRNNSTVPIVVNSIRLYDCQNLITVCGMHYPKVRIAPRQQRRVLTLSYGSDGVPSSYRYEYSVSAVQEEEPRN